MDPDSCMLLLLLVVGFVLLLEIVLIRDLFVGLVLRLVLVL